MKKNIFEVDVDNPNFTFMADPISSHSRLAGVYKFRPPYLKIFFHQAANKIGLSKTDNLLDLCCGRGEIAAGFSEYVNHIKAVDGSDKMLANAINLDNVKYYLANVNTDQMSFIEKVDHIVIGSAIHWINGERLFDIASRSLSPKSNIFVSHTLFKFDEQAYAYALRNLNHRYGRESLNVDLWGREKLDSCGFIRTDGVRLVRNISFDLDFLYQNQLSYAYNEFYHNISEKADDYKHEFFQTLSPLSTNGRVSATLVNWGEIYSPKVTSN